MVYWDQAVIKFFSILTLIGTVIIFLYLIDLVASKLFKKRFFDWLWKYSGKRALFFIFLISLASTLGSLIFSEILNFTPCTLCWFQRIFMYPIAFISGLALVKKQKSILPYILLLSLIGAPIAGYHYLGQVSENTTLPCSAIGYSASCSDSFFLQFGFITIPMMALVAFLLIFILFLIRNQGREQPVS